LVLQEFSQQSQGSSRIASLLNQPIQHLAFVIDGAPQPHPLAADLHDHFVQVPTAGGLGPGPPEILCEGLAELQGPAANGLVAGLNTAPGHHLLDIPKAEGEPEVEPNGQTDDVGREPMALEGDWLHGHSPFGDLQYPEPEKVWR
jgi:hypothetical protein